MAISNLFIERSALYSTIKVEQNISYVVSTYNAQVNIQRKEDKKHAAKNSFCERDELWSGSWKLFAVFAGVYLLISAMVGFVVFPILKGAVP